MLAEQKLKEIVQTHIQTAGELLEGHPELLESITENINKDSTDIGALLRSLSLLKVAPNSTMEFVAGMGEIWSAQLLNAYLQARGVPAAWLNARDVLIVDGKESGLGEKG